MKARLTAALLGLLFAAGVSHGAVPRITTRVDSPQAAYAMRRLNEVAVPSGSYELAIDAQLGPESFAIQTRNGKTMISGGDGRGLIYGALAVREQLMNRLRVDQPPATVQKPAPAFRGIKINTPWAPYQQSS